MAKIVRPLHGHLQVWLPFRPGGENYAFLKELCGERIHVVYVRGQGYFDVARGHLGVLVDELPAALGRPVELVIHGSTQTKCVEACWKDGKPERYWACECSCAGRNHGSGSPLAKDLGGGLSVDTDYTTETYTLTP